MASIRDDTAPCDDPASGAAGPPSSVSADPSGSLTDGLLAEQAWCSGDMAGASDAADRGIASGTDTDWRAAGVAAAVATADGALLDAAGRWRSIAAASDGTAGAWAYARAALTAVLAGDTSAAAHDLDRARGRAPDPLPRGLTALIDSADATAMATRGEFTRAARCLAGLAAATVPADPMVSDRWDELAVAVVAASGAIDSARTLLGEHTGSPTTRSLLLTAWLDLRTGRLVQARDGLAAVGNRPILRRNAVLAAAVGVGLARRSVDDDAMTSTWQRITPIIAGADVELLLLDAWGELSVGAARVSLDERDAIVDAMAGAVRRAGSPRWCVAADCWWRLQRALLTDDLKATLDAGDGLAVLAVERPRLLVQADAAATCAAILTGIVDAPAISAMATRLAAIGLWWEAAALCRAGAACAAESATATALLGIERRFRAEVAIRRRVDGQELSDRERDVGALVIDGLTYKEIGARLFLSPRTVEQHAARLRQKLSVSSRATLVAALRIHIRR